MNFGNIVRESTTILRHNAIRTILTILGISVGVGAFICVVEISNAGSSVIEKQLQNLGDNFIWIEAGSCSRNGIRYGARGDRTLTLSDAEVKPLDASALFAMSGTLKPVWRSTSKPSIARNKSPI